jgi:NADPH:quinone reductase-like Zn-dependent oxidoreductase
MARIIKKLFLGAAALAAVALLAGAVVISHDAACPAPPPLADGVARMKGVTYRCYGTPDVLAFGDVAKPVPGDDRILVKVQAASANPLDWHYLRGTPYIMRMGAGIGAPTVNALGVDFSGTVEAVGKNVTRFKPGDAVFGGRTGAFAEYVSVREAGALALKPDNLGFEQAAAVPIAGVTALQALRDKGQLQAGQKVLINGASGGVGTFAVQIAKSMGAEVTGVCSTRNVGLVRSLGADHVIDYTTTNFTEGAERYDLIVDLVGSQGLLDYRRVLTPAGRLVIVGGKDGKWLGPLMAPLAAVAIGPFVEQPMGMMLAELNAADLAVLADLMRAGKVTPVIDRTYPLAETAEAIRYLETGRARGKVVIRVAGG